MTNKEAGRFLGPLVFFFVLLGMLLIVMGVGRAQVQSASGESPAFSEFKQHVKDYVALQKGLPRLRPTRQRKEIVARRSALAQKIRETRPNAKVGDIFTPEIAKEFQRVIQSVFQGPNAANVRKTIRQGEPLPGWKLSVNGEYPEHLPLTTIPPTLLVRLPQLPAEVAYGLIGHDFILQDVEARVVIDFIAGALP